MTVEDNPLMNRSIADFVGRFTDACVAFNAYDNTQALSLIDQASLAKTPLDFVTTDINRTGGSGVELIKRIRSLHDSTVVSGCLRAKHVPIVVLTGGGYTLENIKAIYKLDPSIKIFPKGSTDTMENFAQAIVTSIAKYRHRILKGFQHLGLSVYWANGRYLLASAFSVPAMIENKYIAGTCSEAERGYSRLILVNDHAVNASRSIDIFEQMLNNPSLQEQDFQDFFEQFPEFLLGDQHDSYWAEPRLHSEASGKRIRPDFVLQPSGDRSDPWNWSIVDLKRHDVDLLSSQRFHADFSRYVYRVMTQLRDYRDFFEDPRNRELLLEQFGGVVPSPRLTAVIGRMPTNEKELFSKLSQRNEGITIKTYDEILEFRRAKVSRLIHYQS